MNNESPHRNDSKQKVVKRLAVIALLGLGCTTLLNMISPKSAHSQQPNENDQERHAQGQQGQGRGQRPSGRGQGRCS